MTNRGFFDRLDWKIVLCWLGLVLVGILSIYASIYSSGPSSIFDLASRSGKQAMWFGIAFAMALLILFVVKPHVWEVFSLPAYIGVICLLLAVLVFGSTVNGSKSWFQLGPISFQPAELSKITTYLMVAHLLRGKPFTQMHGKERLLLAAVIALPMLVILAEGETGTILVYAGLLFVFYREGLSGWWIVILFVSILLFCLAITRPWWVAMLVLLAIVGGYYAYGRAHGMKNRSQKRSLLASSLLAFAVGTLLIFSTSFVFEHVLRPHQKGRIEVLLGMNDDVRGVGYNVHQSMIAIGSGGLTGKGFLKGTQTSYGFVPEQSTDFIFCTIGEEAGFLGCAGVILLFVTLIFLIIKDAEECRERFTRVYGYCVASALFMHLIINVGMTIGIMPVIGIPLPFISYGGSSMMSFTLMLFIFLSLLSQEKKYF